MLDRSLPSCPSTHWMCGCGSPCAPQRRLPPTLLLKENVGAQSSRNRGPLSSKDTEDTPTETDNNDNFHSWTGYDGKELWPTRTIKDMQSCLTWPEVDGAFLVVIMDFVGEMGLGLKFWMFLVERVG